MRRALGARLPIRQVAAQDAPALAGEGFGERDQQRRVAVASGAVRQDEPAGFAGRCR
jgi:hypothetical protein